MKKLLNTTLDEDWKQNVMTGLLGASLLASPAVATAAQKQSQPKSSVQSNQYDQRVIDSIVGEAGGEGYEGMLAVACAIRNRMKVPYYKKDPLKGVYGKNASHIKNEKPQVFNTARKAWDDSAHKDVVGGAYIWGNQSDVRLWRMEMRKNPNFWFKNVEQSAQVGGHYFFRDKRK